MILCECVVMRGQHSRECMASQCESTGTCRWHNIIVSIKAMIICIFHWLEVQQKSTPKAKIHGCAHVVRRSAWTPVPARGGPPLLYAELADTESTFPWTHMILRAPTLPPVICSNSLKNHPSTDVKLRSRVDAPIDSSSHIGALRSLRVSTYE